MIYLPVMVGEMVTIQGLYVAPTLCKSMILARDWLERNKARLSFNSARLELGGKEIFGTRINEESSVVTAEDTAIRPLTAISCHG